MMEPICSTTTRHDKKTSLTRYPRVSTVSRLSWGISQPLAHHFCKNRSKGITRHGGDQSRSSSHLLFHIGSQKLFFFFSRFFFFTDNPILLTRRTLVGMAWRRHGIDRGDDHRPRACCAHAESGLASIATEQTFLEPRVRSVRTPDRTHRDDD
jgi:hypothetical protein